SLLSRCAAPSNSPQTGVRLPIEARNRARSDRSIGSDKSVEAEGARQGKSEIVAYLRSCACARSLHRWSDVLVMAEQVRRIVLVLKRHEPVVINPICSSDALGSLFGFEANLIDIIAAHREWTHHLRQLPRPSHVGVVCSGVQPARQAPPLAQGT